MVPLRLELKNFLSYGDLQVIDFSEHNLICLSGKNGHGKSAILDAITWAVWGQARKSSGTTKPDEGLLRLGQTKLLVILEFRIERQVYRVRREFIKSINNKSIASLEFSIVTDNSEYLPLTEKTIRLTQKKIDSVLKVDYETFINSSFLRQGNSNEFSKKSPRERKLLLTKILGFDLYDRMQQKALDVLREKSLRLKVLVAEEKKNDELLKELPVLLKKKKNLKVLLDINKKKLDQEKETKLKLDEKRVELNKQIDEIKRVIEQRDEVVKTVALHREKFLNIINKRRSVHHALLKIKVVKNSKEMLNIAETELTILEKKLLTKVVLSQELALAKNKLAVILDVIKKRLADEKAVLQKEYFAQEKREAILVLEDKQLASNIKKQELLFRETNQQLIDTKMRHENLNKEIIKIVPVKKRAGKIERILLLCNEKERLINIQLLGLQANKLADGKTCPTCKQNLSEKIYHDIKFESMLLQRRLEHQLNRINILRPELILKLEYEKALLRDLSNNVETFSFCESKLSEQLRLQIEQQQQILPELQVLSKKVNQELLFACRDKAMCIEKLSIFEKEQEDILAKEESVVAQKLHILSIETKLVELEGIEEDFAVHKNKLQDLKAQAVIFLEVEQQKAELVIWKDRFAETKMLLKTCLINKIILEEKLSNTEKLKTVYFELKTAWEATVAKIQMMEESQNKLYQEFAAAEALADIRQNQAKENESIQAEMLELSNNISDLEILAEAFGKNGIQVFLIEDVIPEIEQTTNQILSLISETQAKVFIEPLRDLKKGGVRESLDIIISDINGVRDYEMFSGGEAFRIDFALRIGISQVIAKRSGTNLRTLIIDEGFGALDEEGINLMMSCIYRIASQFEKVIVVSHLSVLKEMFPVHLNITKGGSGSVVSIEYRG